MRIFDICENGLYLVIEKAEDGKVHLMHFSSVPYEERYVAHEAFDYSYFI